MIKKLKYKNMPKIYRKQINSFKSITTDLEDIYKIDNSIQFLIYIKKEKIVAYLAFKDLGDNYDIYNIATEEQYQRSGIGQMLLNSLKSKNIILEVKENNKKAINFYKKNNFKEQFIKENYYKDGQNALIMLKEY